MMLTLIMDAVVAVLLIATIGFAIKLNGRLAALRRDSERLQSLIRDLQGASGAAEDAVSELKLTAADAGRALQNTIDGARTLEADLRFITERGEEVANRLEAGLRIQRDQQAATAAATGNGASSPTAAATAAAADKNSQSRLAMLLKQAEAADGPAGRNEPALDPARAKGRAAPPPREPPSAPAPRPPEPRHAEPRAAEPRGGEPRDAESTPQSRAERDLLRALEARGRQ
ncbi:hypothetical protein GCM10011611_51580 [Aliidongia dinghuensis]|uniref:DUF6468 domain-containing protein n=1 Tax=Aliidongia dinghuensis TaxID=1867774 RepID=A0A8J2YXY6_9PROT|nr:DUF6468 domain-containing protein [Aliidongia dinghuensis]GGF38910.1 hypothetical protein GCM10011611_51580 [Aliidongia dinghuensis]